MFRDEQTCYRLRHSNPPESLEVEMDELESKAGEFGIYDLSGFYISRLFKEKRYGRKRRRRSACLTDLLRRRFETGGGDDGLWGYHLRKIVSCFG